MRAVLSEEPTSAPAMGTEVGGPEKIAVPDQEGNLLAALGVPDARRAIHRRRHHPRAGGIEPGAAERAALVGLEHDQRLFGIGVPDAGGAVPRRRHDPFALMIERRVVHLRGMALQGAGLLEGIRPPRCTHGRRRSRTPRGAHQERTRRSAPSWDDPRWRGACRLVGIPDPRRPVEARRHDAPALRIE